MKDLISPKLRRLAELCPYPLYVVGGKARDYLAGFPDGTDTDLCAPAPLDDFLPRAECAGYRAESVYRNTGTVKLRAEGEEIEFASFRSDEYVRGEHSPARTFFTDDIALDARRRDFKCNAVYYDIVRGEWVDPLGGIEDIRARRITTVAPAEKVFSEDGLRLMRLARIAAQTGFKPSADCLSGAKANCALIRDVHAERVRTELDLILHADRKYGRSRAQYEGLKILEETGVLAVVLPELVAGKGVKQREDFHKYDVLEHSLRAAAYADEEVRLAALLHDIGKPYCMKTVHSFIGHETEGARMAEEVCERLKVPKQLAEETVRLIALHMYDLRGDARENKVRKFILANYDLFDKLLALKQADFSACKDDFSRAPSVVKLQSIERKMREEGVPFTLKELDLRGDVLLADGFPPESVGTVLARLLADCAIGAVPNEREKLREYAKKTCLAPLLRRQKRGKN